MLIESKLLSRLYFKTSLESAILNYEIDLKSARKFAMLNSKKKKNKYHNRL